MDGTNRCLVAEETQCNFFVLVNGYCQLGRFSLDDNQYVGNSLSDSTISFMVATLVSKLSFIE